MKTPTMPPQVKIGPLWYSIRFYANVDEAEDAGSFGQVNMNRQTIRLECGLKRARLAVAFVHEVLHVCNCMYGPKEDRKGRIVEEESVGACAMGLTAFWQDNPGAAAWWADLAQRDPDKVYEE